MSTTLDASKNKHVLKAAKNMEKWLDKMKYRYVQLESTPVEDIPDGVYPESEHFKYWKEDLSVKSGYVLYFKRDNDEPLDNLDLTILQTWLEGMELRKDILKRHAPNSAKAIKEVDAYRRMRTNELSIVIEPMIYPPSMIVNDKASLFREGDLEKDDYALYYSLLDDYCFPCINIYSNLCRDIIRTIERNGK